MSMLTIQSSIQFGEVSRLLHARVDSPIYYHSVKRLRNMIVTPQGGAEKRFGTIYIGEINNHTATPTYLTNYQEVKPFIFDYEDGNRYLLIFRSQAVDIYYNNTYQTTTVTDYSASEIKDLSLTQSANVVYIVHGSHPPRSLTRTSVSPVALTITTPTFIEYPTFDFKQNYDNYSFNIFTANTTTPLPKESNLLGQIVTIYSSGPIFDGNYVGGLFVGEGGTIRITQYKDAQNANGRIINTFDPEASIFHTGSTPPNAISGQDCVVAEIAFSAVRGYPRECAFYQNRLFLSCTTSLLGGVWGSNYNGYSFDKLHFDDSEAQATNAISTILQGNKSTIVTQVLGFKSLLVFTTSGLYSTPLLTETPLTPDNVSFLNLQTSDSTNNVHPVIFDNDVIFFDKGGKKVKSVNVFATTQHYETKVLSVLAPHLVDRPYSAAVYENSTAKDGNWLLMTNNGTELDGKLSIYQSVPEQEISAWSLSTTGQTTGGSKFRHVVSDEENAFFIVERVVNGSTRLFIEQLSFDTYLDAAFIGTPTSVPGTVVTGLSYLEGETVTILADGAPVASKVVSGGQITLDSPASVVQVGLGWEPELVPLPVNFTAQNGNNLYQPKSIKSIYVDFYESTGVRVNGDLIPPFRFNEDRYNEPPALETASIQVQPMGGWDPDQEIIISNSVPLPLQILGICFVVSV